MHRRNLTRIEIKLEDIQEYSKKVESEKQCDQDSDSSIPEPSTSNSTLDSGSMSSQAQQQMIRQTRIGFRK
ncbi:hypothetical protein RDWZM_003835 [Blomia tropicalis]|uniref:Anaphase-promoting complex subunit CDC26 n=1 Tax=Blomia tropicalis TaxID=40697 RepID=A0A9Q0MK56_BLOTA|nr:hypothetical protein BLOT_002496 [Blomia tropicalis]KAJ6225290.1 hypothetical protein RDWZM_003835 [Blomia tropicalis]